ncbi:MAG: hypothetical protein QGG76_01930, partial [Candidatus Thalassarchaeaceae archaeon]|nr:hypothetical protein [Candidatus Thalassarchaeaceae archaeon]
MADEKLAGQVDEKTSVDPEEAPVDPLDSWEDGAAFGVSEDKDPLCEAPVEDWMRDIDIVSTEEVP